jgi:hypothetical protein
MDHSGTGRPVAIINAAMAQRFFRKEMRSENNLHRILVLVAMAVVALLAMLNSGAQSAAR